MKRFFEICMGAKIVAVELTALFGFLAVLAVVLRSDWSHVVQFFFGR